MAAPSKDPLREILKRELEELAADASAIDPIVPSNRLKTLTDLGKLIEVRDSLEAKPRKWLLPLAFVITLAIASFLQFTRVCITEIEIDASLGQLSVVLTKEQQLTEAANLTALEISGLRDVQIPLSQDLSKEAIASPNYLMTDLRVSVSAEGPRTGSLTLAPVIVPANAQVILSHSDVANQLHLSIKGNNLELHAAAYGYLRVSGPGLASRVLNYTSPKQIPMRAGTEEINLDLTFPKLPGYILSPQLDVRDIGLTHIDQFLGQNQTLVKRLSNVLSGTLYLEELDDKALKLRPGEVIDFGHSEGEIGSLRLAADRIDLKFHGDVAGMTEGTGKGHRSIMPTRLEWLKARHGIALLWGVALSLFGLLRITLSQFGARL